MDTFDLQRAAGKFSATARTRRIGMRYRPPMVRAQMTLVLGGWLTAALAACSSSGDAASTAGAGASAGAAGASAGSGGQSGKSGAAGGAGQPGGGKSGSGGAPAGSAGKAGASGVAGQGGKAGASGAAGQGSQAGVGGAASGGAAGNGGSGGGPLTGPGHVRIEAKAAGFTLLRDDAPYFIRGVGGQTRIERAAQAGANSTRTWGSENASTVLDTAKANGMTVLLGIWLDHNPASYGDDAYKNARRKELQGLLDQHKNHPALLMWALGNELNLETDTPAAWQFVEELIAMVHAQDPNHPAITVLAGANVAAINHVVQHAPSADALGINTYGGIGGTEKSVGDSMFKKPYLVTEWGPTGHWEAASTSWMRPIEPTSDQKATSYADRYQFIVGPAGKCLGSYVFLWGQKQERTPTWYGMFVEDQPALGLKGEAAPTVDVMQHVWTGQWPANRAPAVTALTLAGQSPTQNVTLAPGASVPAVITASDPDGDALTYVWEVLEEPSALGSGGSFEPRPPAVPGAIKGAGGTVQVTAPKAGEYRLFAYAFDGKGSVGTANVPFRVQ